LAVFIVLSDTDEKAEALAKPFSLSLLFPPSFPSFPPSPSFSSSLPSPFPSPPLSSLSSPLLLLFLFSPPPFPPPFSLLLSSF
ncbi:hypothetical protein ACXWR7_11920, partial [Streptococcus pyogenes]